MIISWTALKAVLTSRDIVVHGTEDTEQYFLQALDGSLRYECILSKLSPLQADDLLDFETNYKPTWNARLDLVDEEGATVIKSKVTDMGWHFEPRSIDFYTAKLNSLYNRKHDGAGINDGTDYGDAVLKFYDGSGVLMTQGELELDAAYQIRLTANCVKTFMDWQPTYDMDIAGGVWMIKDAPTANAYGWIVVAPDIPAGLGGSIPIFGGGWNFSYFQNIDNMQLDGRMIKRLAYDPVNNSNKIRVVIKHAVGAQIGFQVVYKHYKA